MRLAPERVAKLALLDTGSRSDSPEQAERRKAQIGLARAGKLGDIAEALWPLLVHKNRQGDAALKVIVRMAEDAGAEAFMRQQTAIMTRPDSRPDLPAIQCPTLVLVGDGDQLTPPALAEEMAAHPEQPACGRCRQRASLDAGAARSCDQGAGGMDGGVDSRSLA